MLISEDHGEGLHDFFDKNLLYNSFEDDSLFLEAYSHLAFFSCVHDFFWGFRTMYNYCEPRARKILNVSFFLFQKHVMKQST